MIHRQAENNRIRWLFAMDNLEEREVVYWGVRGRTDRYPAPGARLTDAEVREAGQVLVQLAPLKLREAQLLLAHGYSLADAAVRGFWSEAASLPPATALPFFDKAGNPTSGLAA